MNIKMRMKNLVYVFGLMLLIPQFSFALAEARLTYGGLVSKDFANDACGTACSSTPPGVVPFVGLGADVIISPPLFPFGFGLRYEKIGLTGSLSNISVDTKIERIAALVNYRIIDTIIHFGPIFSLGISTQTDLQISDNGTPAVHYKSTTSDSLTAGLELTIKPLIVIPISVGAEAGYEYLKVRKAVDSVGGGEKDFDLSGTYIKILLGLDF